MTHEEIDQLEAGFELNATIAVKVFGWKKVEVTGHNFSGFGYFRESRIYDIYELPNYSTDISAAWEVVEKMKEHKGEWFALEYYPAEDSWEAGWKYDDYDTGPSWSIFRNHATAKTLPLAICRAALKAVISERK